MGGAFLCYEGLHKVLARFVSKPAENEAHKLELRAAVVQGKDALAALEKEKVKGAIITDLVLSAEIVAIALSAVTDAPTQTKALVLAAIALGMTVGIYGSVAVLVKLDDIGLHLLRGGGLGRAVGGFIVSTMPKLMKVIGVVGTLAMFLVGGGIIVADLPLLGTFITSTLPTLGWPSPWPALVEAGAGLAVGLVVGAAWSRSYSASPPAHAVQRPRVDGPGRMTSDNRHRGRRDGPAVPLPHHRTCGSASGGSVR